MLERRSRRYRSAIFVMCLKQITIDLLLRPTGATHVIAVTTAKEKHMITANAEQTLTTVAAAGEQPKATKKARVGAQRRPKSPLQIANSSTDGPHEFPVTLSASP